MKCKYCGSELQPGDKFCQECGKKVEDVILNQEPVQTSVPPQSVPPVYEQPQSQGNYAGVYMDEPKNNNKKLLPMLIVLAVAIVLGIVVGGMVLGGSKPTEPTVVEKKEERLDKDEPKVDKKEEKLVKETPASTEEDIMLVEALSCNKSLKDLEKLAAKYGREVEDGYEIDGQINGYEVTYYITFDEKDGVEIDTFFYLDSKAEYDDMFKYLKNYFDKNYDRDPYEVEEEANEYVYEKGNDFIMMFTYEEQNGLFLYRTIFED